MKNGSSLNIMLIVKVKFSNQGLTEGKRCCFAQNIALHYLLFCNESTLKNLYNEIIGNSDTFCLSRLILWDINMNYK